MGELIRTAALRYGYELFVWAFLALLAFTVLEKSGLPVPLALAVSLVFGGLLPYHWAKRERALKRSFAQAAASGLGPSLCVEKLTWRDCDLLRATLGELRIVVSERTYGDEAEPESPKLVVEVEGQGYERLLGKPDWCACPSSCELWVTVRKTSPVDLIARVQRDLLAAELISRT